MANIIHAGGGNPAIAEIWTSDGALGNSDYIFSADTKCIYNLSEDGLKVSDFNADLYWKAESKTCKVTITPLVEQLHCLIVPYGRNDESSITSFSGGATYEILNTFDNLSTKNVGRTGGKAYDLMLSSMTAGTTYTMSFHFPKYCMNTGWILIVYDD